MFLSQMVQLPHNTAWCMHGIVISSFCTKEANTNLCWFAFPHAFMMLMRPHFASYNRALKYHSDFNVQNAVANLPHLPLFLWESSVSCSRRKLSIQKRSSTWCSYLESCRCWLRALLWGSLRICLEVARYYILHWSLLVRWNTDRRQASVGDRRSHYCRSTTYGIYKKWAISVKWSLLAFHEGLLVWFHGCRKWWRLYRIRKTRFYYLYVFESRSIMEHRPIDRLLFWWRIEDAFDRRHIELDEACT